MSMCTALSSLWQMAGQEQGSKKVCLDNLGQVVQKKYGCNPPIPGQEEPKAQPCCPSHPQPWSSTLLHKGKVLGRACNGPYESWA